MQLHTPVEIPNSTFKITSHSKGLIIGSCFAERIAERLSQFRFTIQTNPHGIIYNPASILQTLQALQANTKYTQADLIQHSGLYHSPAHHGLFSTPTAAQTLENINSVKLENQPNYLIITLGTAWIYKLNGATVANCHKLPESYFTRNRLTFSEIADFLTQIAELFPLAHKIFTVSPIRHIKDGLTENSLSKALLRSAIGQTIDSRNDCCYFPAYEIMMDELRDYRFYAPDMTHPTAQATDYIITRFISTYFDNSAVEYSKKIAKLTALAAHRPLHPDTEQHKQFKISCQEQLKALTEQYPEKNFSDLFATFV